MKALATVALFLLATPALASKCYRHETDPDWTVIENDPGVSPEFVVREHDVITEYDSMSVGTGMNRRTLVSEGARTVLYRYIGDDLLIDNELFHPGCTVDRTWVDSAYTHVLIARDERPDSSYYFIDAGQPVTTCRVVESSFDGEAVDVQCDSRRRTLKLQTRENQMLVLDGVEMKPYAGPLPCAAGEAKQQN